MAVFLPHPHLFQVYQNMIGIQLCALDSKVAFQLKKENQDVTALMVVSLCPLHSPVGGMYPGCSSAVLREPSQQQSTASWVCHTSSMVSSPPLHLPG